MLRGSDLHAFAATLIRPASIAAFAAEAAAFVQLARFLGGMPWRGFRLGGPFWTRLGDMGVWIALACLVPSLLLAAYRRLRPADRLKATGWCVCLNVATMGLALFVPAIAFARA